MLANHGFENYEIAAGGHPEVVPLGGSLKSLAFMRECPKARSDKAGFRD